MPHQGYRYARPRIEVGYRNDPGMIQEFKKRIYLKESPFR